MSRRVSVIRRVAALLMSGLLVVNNAGVITFAEEIILSEEEELQGEQSDVISDDIEIDEEELWDGQLPDSVSDEETDLISELVWDEDSPLIEDPLQNAEVIVTNTHIPDSNSSGITDVTVNTTWQDNWANGVEFGDVRPGIVMTLESTTAGANAEDSEWAAVTFDSTDTRQNPVTLTNSKPYTSNTISQTWSGLPTYVSEDGTIKRIYYRVVESAPESNPNALTGYIVSTDSTDTVNTEDPNRDRNRIVTVNITHAQKYVTVSAAATFADTTEVYYKDISKVTFSLYRVLNTATGMASIYLTTYDITPESSNSAAFSGTYSNGNEPVKLPQYDSNGNEYKYSSFEYSYTAKGVTVFRIGNRTGGYNSEEKRNFSTEDASGAFAGTYTTSTTNTLLTKSITAKNNWDDNNNQDGIRPTDAKFSLLRKTSASEYEDLGASYQKTIADNVTWDNLPNYDIYGKEYTYDVTVLEIPGYAASKKENRGTFEFTNTHRPGITTVTASKVWNLALGNTASGRSAVFVLQKKVEGNENWEDVSSFVLDGEEDITNTYPRETSSWYADWGELPSFTAGKRNHYRVVEKDELINFIKKEKAREYAAVTEEDITANGGTDFVYKNEITGTQLNVAVKVEKTFSEPAGSELYKSIQAVTFKIQRKILESDTEWMDLEQTITAIPTSDGSATYTGELRNLEAAYDENEYYIYRAVELSYQLGSGEGAATVAAQPDASDVLKGRIGAYNYVVTNPTVIDMSEVTDSEDSFRGTWKATATNTLITESVTVTKDWNDANNQDGKRPSARLDLQRKVGSGIVERVDSFIVQKRDTAAQTVLTNTWTNLPRYTMAGEKYTYQLMEPCTTDGTYTPSYKVNDGEVVTGMESTALTATVDSDKTSNTVAFTNIHTPEKTSVTATKIWSDADNRYGDRPESVTFTLKAKIGETELTSEQYTALKTNLDRVHTVTGESEWTTSWTDLPVYMPGMVGQAITYSVEETAIKGYAVSQEGNKITNTQTTTSLTATKNWGTSTINIFQNPLQAYLQLQRRALTSPAGDWTNVGDVQATEQVSSSETETSSTVTWTGLPTHNKEGVKHEYRAIETGIAIHGSEDNVPTIAIEYADTTQESGETNGNGFAYSALTMQAADGDGAEGTGAYTSLITNTPHTGSVTVTKDWQDNADQDGVRPTSVTFTLKAHNDASTGEWQYFSWSDTITLNAENNWTHTWSNMPYVDAVGRDMIYSVEEVDVDGKTTVPDNYSVSYQPQYREIATSSSTTTAPTFTVINTHIPETVSVSTSKVWDDANNRDGKRSEVTFTLMQQIGSGEVTQVSKDQSATAVTAKQVSANATGKNATVTWTNLPKYAAGTRINYTVIESSTCLTGDKATGYVQTISADTDTTDNYAYTVINTHTPSTVTIKAIKTWADDNDQDGIRPDSITYGLYKSLTGGYPYEYVTQSAASKNDTVPYSAEWTDLPEYDNGKKITYLAVELKIGEEEPIAVGSDPLKTLPPAGRSNGYEVRCNTTTKNNVTTYSFTNIHTPETVKVDATLKWKDLFNAEKRRPDSVVLDLYKQVEGTDSPVKVDGKSLTLSTADETSDNTTWKDTLEELPKYEKGKVISYTLKLRSSLSGYDEDYTNNQDAAYDATTIDHDDFVYTITATHVPGPTSVTATLKWIDKASTDAMREDVTLHLLKDGKVVDGSDKKISATASGSALTVTWQNLTAFTDTGAEIPYTIEVENAASDTERYETAVEKTSAAGEDAVFTVTKTLKSFSVSFNTDGHGSAPETQSISYDGLAEASTVTAAGYTFVGWYLGNTAYNFASPVESNMTLTARWSVNNYKISYDLAGGKLADGDSNPVEYTVESSTFILKNPTRDGYLFTGWTGTGIAEGANKNVTVEKGAIGDRSYKANWQAITITTETEVGIKAKKLTMDSKLKVAQKSNYLSITWGKVEGAVSYYVYATYCGDKFGNPIKVSSAKSSIKIKKIKGKKLNLKKNYKTYVEAIGSNGKVICKTIVAHVVGRKNTRNTNVSGIKLERTRVTLKRTGKYTLKGTKLRLADKSKKKLGNGHGKALRYASSDISVAKVSPKGVIRAVGKGECVIYVYAINGYAKKIKVTVK